jgi:hypothetical protein
MVRFGAYNRPSCPCHYCTYRDGFVRQGAVDKAKADDQRHAGERQHHHLQARKAVGGKQRKIVHDTPPKDVPVISRMRAAGRFSRWHPSHKWFSPPRSLATTIVWSGAEPPTLLARADEVIE